MLQDEKRFHMNWKMKDIPKMQTSKVTNKVHERGFNLIQMFQFQSIWHQMPTINPNVFTSKMLSMLKTQKEVPIVFKCTMQTQFFSH
jgi:hypothetical protein